MMVLYFSYGSNLTRDVITTRAPSVSYVGKARLPGYRLCFSRRSIRTGTGVANVIPQSGFTAMGVLYEVPESEWIELRRKEGALMARPAYTEIDVTVYSFSDKSSRHAVTFAVLEPEPLEQIPSPDYISAMAAEAARVGLVPYAKFLQWLQRRAATTSSPPLRTGLLVVGTTERRNYRGRYIVRANRELFGKAAKTRLVSIDFDGRTTLASFQAADDIPDGVCQVDQNLRHALGMLGQDSYGYTIELRAKSQPTLRLPSLATPRVLCLKVHQTNWTDSEKRICILHPKNMVMLGVKEGEHIEVESATRAPGGRLVVKSVKIRVFCSEQRPGQVRAYPQVDEVYLDRECRDELGLPPDRKDFLDWPVLVRPSVSHLLRRRAAVYGVTFFLGTSSLSQVLTLLVPTLSGLTRGLMAVLTAIVATLIVAWIDMKTTIGY